MYSLEKYDDECTHVPTSVVNGGREAKNFRCCLLLCNVRCLTHNRAVLTEGIEYANYISNRQVRTLKKRVSWI